MSTLPYIHVWNSPDPSGAVRWYAAFMLRLVRCAAGRMEPGDSDSRESRLHAQQADFINALFCTDVERVLALRYCIDPKANNYAAGRIDVALLGKIAGTTEGQVRVAAQDYLREVIALVGGALPNHVWEAVTDSARFETLWSPLSWEHAHVAEIRRRVGLVDLDTARPRPMLGRGRADAVKADSNEDKVFVAYPFKPRGGVLTRLLRSLLLFQQPVVWQVTVSPTRLDATEEQELLRQIGKCEQYLASGGKAGISREVATLNARRVNMLCEMLVEQMVRLEDAPYLLNIAVACAQPVPRMLIEAIGVEITRPVTGEGDPQGGYDVFLPQDTQDKDVARANISELDFGVWGQRTMESSLPRARLLVDALQAAGAFRLPFSDADGLPGIDAQVARYRPMPREIAEIADGVTDQQRLLIGENRYLGLAQPAYLHERDRSQHLYVIGQTGTGKTTMLKRMIVDDMLAGKGLAIIDPHGDLYEELLSEIPKHRKKDVVLFNPADEDYPVGLNLLECADPTQRHLVVREMKAIMERLLSDQYGQKAADYAGPAFYQHMQMNMLLAMSNPGDPGTLIEFYEIFQHKDYWRKWQHLNAGDDPHLRRWVENFLPNTDYTLRSNKQDPTWGEYLSNKFEEFVFDPRLRRIFGQKHSTIDLGDIMDSGKILLVNLAKGLLTEANSRFLGMALMAKLQAAVMQRVTQEKANRRPFYLYVDEFQSLATSNFTLMLSEARKFGLGLVLANQFLSQIKDKNIVDSVLGNVGTLISFRIGEEDAKVLEPQFKPYFDAFDLTNMPNWTACVKTKAAGQVVNPFSINTVNLEAGPQHAKVTREEVVASSRQRYTRPRAEVDAMIEGGYPAHVVVQEVK